MSQEHKQGTIDVLKGENQPLGDVLNEAQTILDKANNIVDVWGSQGEVPSRTLEDILAEQNGRSNRSASQVKIIHPNAKPVMISVDCIRNNEEDIAAGGPEFLGYDFVVDEAKVEELRHYITLLIKRQKQPIIKAYVCYDAQLTPEHIWSMDDIKSCIVKGFS